MWSENVAAAIVLYSFVKEREREKNVQEFSTAQNALKKNEIDTFTNEQIKKQIGRKSETENDLPKTLPRIGIGRQQTNKNRRKPLSD